MKEKKKNVVRRIEILQFEELRKHAYTMSEEDIWICEATPKYKGKFADKVLIKVGDEAIPYESLLPADRNSYSQDVQPFFYIYVDGN